MHALPSRERRRRVPLPVGKQKFNKVWIPFRHLNDAGKDIRGVQLNRWSEQVNKLQ
jgi:hypothetical protein